MMDLIKKGHINRTKKGIRLWLEWYEKYSDPVNPMTVEEIAKAYKHTWGKKEGQPYNRAYIYQAFQKLEKIPKELIDNIKNSQ